MYEGEGKGVPARPPRPPARQSHVKLMEHEAAKPLRISRCGETAKYEIWLNVNF